MNELRGVTCCRYEAAVLDAELASGSLCYDTIGEVDHDSILFDFR